MLTRPDGAARWRGTGWLAGLMAALWLLGSSSALWGARMACGISQVSRTENVGVGAEVIGISRLGDRLLILSRGNPTGRNPDYSFELFQVNIEGDQVVQLTQTTGLGVFGSTPASSDSLNRVVFRSNLNLTGENPGRSQQIFLFDAVGRAFLQLTRLSGNLLSDPAPEISADGSVVAFVSRADLTGGNADGSRELFLYDLAQQSFLQVTQLPQTSRPLDFALSRDGRKVAVLISHSLSGFSEIDLFDRTSGSARILLDLPSTNELVAAGGLWLSYDASRLFFVSGVDGSGGGNLDGSPQLFLLPTDIQGVNPVPKQITHLPFAPGSNTTPGVGLTLGMDMIAVSGDGRQAVFRTAADLLDWQGEGAENLFRVDVDSGELFQLTYLTAPGGGGGRILLSEDGSRMAFSSRSDPVQQNRDQNQEAFFSQCEPSQTFYFPQVGNGLIPSLDLRFQTSFIFANTAAASSVQVEFFDQRGERLPLSLGEFGYRSFYGFQLDRGVPLLVSTSGGGAVDVGYARVTTGPNITGTAVFTGVKATTHTILYEAAVPLSEPLTDFSVVVNTSGHFQTGLAMVNTQFSTVAPAEDRAALITLKLYDENFKLLGENRFSLAAGAHVASFVDQTLFPTVSMAREMVGMLTVTSSQPLAVISLRQNDNPQLDFPYDIPTLTTLPVAPGRPDR